MYYWKRFSKWMFHSKHPKWWLKTKPALSEFKIGALQTDRQATHVSGSLLTISLLLKSQSHAGPQHGAHYTQENVCPHQPLNVWGFVRIFGIKLQVLSGKTALVKQFALVGGWRNTQAWQDCVTSAYIYVARHNTLPPADSLISVYLQCNICPGYVED